MMRVVGLTGPIGSGKSTVTKFFEEKGALVIDADLIAQEVTGPDTPAWKEIVEHFGEAILEFDRKINRRELGRVAFADPEELAFLNRVIHPQVIAEIEERLREIESEFGDGKVVIMDVPLLFEVGLNKLSDITVVVTADRDVRLDRLLKRGISRDEAEDRIESQRNKENLDKSADVVITNNGTVAELKEKVEDLWKRIAA